MNLSLLLEMAAEAAPERKILGPHLNALSCSDLARASQSIASWLRPQPIECVAHIGLNSVAVPAALFGAAIAGKRFVPLNYRLPDADLRRVLERTAPAVAIVDADMTERVRGIAGVTLVSREEFEAIGLRAIDSKAVDAADDSGVALMLFTSGTTGEPKAALLRHHPLTSYVISSAEFMGGGEDEASVVSVPPYHIAAISAVLTGVYTGRRIVYLPTFNAEDWVDTVVSEKITHAMVVPTMLVRIVEVLENRGQSLPDLKHVSYGGGRMPLPVIERAMRLLPHVDFVNAYGLTETSSTIAILAPEDHRRAMRSDDPHARRRLASVGRPVPSVEVEIRAPEGGPVPAGVTGEVFVRGEQVAGEYSHRKALSDDGWFGTHDSGWMDDEGYLYIEGRLDDVIVKGGENISPGEIEDVLRQHPNVADVAVIGVPDEQWGESVAAVMVSKGATPSVDELRDWVKTRLRSTKTPSAWHFREQLPYTETGKLLRRVLKQDLSAR